MRFTQRNLILVCFFAFVGGCGIDSPAEKGRSAEKVVRGNLEGTSVSVDVQSTNGSIWVRADPQAKRVSIEAIIQAGGTTASEGKKRLAGSSLVSKVIDGTVQVRLKFPEPSFDSDGGRITIIVPELRAVDATSTHGRITISNANGKVDIATTNGAVDVASCTEHVKAYTTNGKITVRDCLADMSLKTLEGDVLVRQAIKAVTAVTKNGSIEVYCADQGAGPVNLESSNADIKLECGQSFKGSIRMKTVDGKVKIIDPEKRAKMVKSESATGVVVMGEGDQSNITTTNGTVQVVIR